MIRQIVDRLHVSASPREVIAEVRGALKKSTRKHEYRESRHRFYREALKIHQENVDLYCAVMRGTF